MNALAIIPARGGSKRIIGKNIKNFKGKPIITYSIDAALKSKCFNEVMVSTDDVNIGDIAKNNGAKVPFYRSEETSDDYSTISDVLIEVINEYEKREQKFEYVCCIYPTAPIVSADKIIEGYNILREYDIDAVLPVVRYSYPPQRGLVIEDGYVKMWNRTFARSRSQDLDDIYHDSGQFVWLKVENFKKTKDIFSGNIKAILLSEIEVQDIDTLEDWKLAEMKYDFLSKTIE